MAEEPPPVVVTVSSSPDGEGGDVVEFGRSRRGRRLGPWIAVAAVVALVALLIVRAHEAHDQASATPAATNSPQAGPTPALTLGLAETHGWPILETGGDWQIAALGNRTLYRLDPATGAVGTTPVPDLPTAAPPSLVYGASWTVVMPSDDATGGYVVADGLPAMPLPGTVSGPALPGPDDNHVWIRFTYSDPPQLGLYDPVGAPFPGSVVAPGVVASPGPVTLPDNDGDIWPDGRGGVMTSAFGQLWLGGSPDPVAIIPSTVLLAEGAGERVVASCGAQPGCDVYLDSGPSQPATHLDVQFLGGKSVPGLVAPDRRHAALILGGRLALLDLRPAHVGLVYPNVELGGAGSGSIAWSPDGQWLLAVEGGGSLFAIDVASIDAVGHSAGAIVQYSLLPPYVKGITTIAVRSIPMEG